MKRTQIIRRTLLPLIFVIWLAGVVSAADCEHEFAERREEPGCESGGAVWMECIHCGHTTGLRLLDPVGHSYGEWYVLTGPTCTREGLQARDCLVCGGQETAPVPPLGHSYTSQVKHPTCTAGGYTRFNCRACTSYYIADYTDPLGHWYDSGVLIKEPTETARGRVRFTCVRCSESHLMTYAFRDIDSSAYYFTPVLWAVDSGITTGLDETHFGPDAPCTRAQVVTFLWRAAGKPEPGTAANPFVDVPQGSFYEKAVLWAFENGITTGTDGTHFSPDTPCTRAQVVTFLHRFRGCPDPTAVAAFPDVPQGAYYRDAVLWAAHRGITVGMDGGLFRPDLSCTRAQIVTFLYRDEKNP